MPCAEQTGIYGRLVSAGLAADAEVAADAGQLAECNSLPGFSIVAGHVDVSLRRFAQRSAGSVMRTICEAWYD
jgi:hypothetical protein